MIEAAPELNSAPPVTPRKGLANWQPKHSWGGSPEAPFPLPGVVLGVLSNDGQKLKIYRCDVTDPHRMTTTADKSRVVFFGSAEKALDHVEPDSVGAFLYPKDFKDAPQLPLEDGTYSVSWWSFGGSRGPGRQLVATDEFEIRDGVLAE